MQRLNPGREHDNCEAERRSRELLGAGITDPFVVVPEADSQQQQNRVNDVVLAHRHDRQLFLLLRN